MKRFDEKILKSKELLKLVALKALIIKVNEYVIQRKLYPSLDKSLLKVKQVMKNHIRINGRGHCTTIYAFLFLQG